MIIRQATAADSAYMTTVLNEIIAVGGTTAHQNPFTTERMTSHYIAPEGLVCCHVAEDAGRVIGFQWLGWPRNAEDQMPNGWAVIASFVSGQAAGKGVGQLLFSNTLSVAKTMGVKVIDATIRADNTPGLRYYSGLGFTDYDRLSGVPLRDGTPVDRVRKRYDI